MQADELSTLLGALAHAEFQDGRVTAGWNARSVKNNQQMVPGSAQGMDLQSIIIKAFQRNVAFQVGVRPKMMRPLMFNRYTDGMTYGSHMDDPIMGQNPMLRADVSLTLFLSDPASYEGGELVIEQSGGDARFKLPQNHMVVYPATNLHHVTPVTRGVRLAAVTWVQSMIRDPAQRELLVDLDTAHRNLFNKHGKSRELDLISKTLTNLVRRWAEP
ncbi:MAG TPA: Fe2+-dependent dioxygenase [bacterium]